MAKIVRPLLVAGNDKLAPSVMHFDVPAGIACPGKSKLCFSRCYARRGRFAFPQVRERLQWGYEQSKRGDFVRRMSDELYRKGVLLMRWHVSGDVYSPAYAREMLEIMGNSLHTTFWLYTRSWRVKRIYPFLDSMSRLSNVKVWLSADAETGYPAVVPVNARVAWMQTEVGEDMEGADLIFLDHPLRKKTIPLTIIEKVCPTETEEGKRSGVSCATCGFCWR